MTYVTKHLDNNGKVIKEIKENVPFHTICFNALNVLWKSKADSILIYRAGILQKAYQRYNDTNMVKLVYNRRPDEIRVDQSLRGALRANG